MPKADIPFEQLAFYVQGVLPELTNEFAVAAVEAFAQVKV